MSRDRACALLLLGLSYLAFVSLGLPDGLLGVAWPSIRTSFALPLDALGVLLITTTGGYVLASFASGRLLARMSVGALLALSCGLTAASLLGYAVAPRWSVVVLLGSLAGLGAGAIDAGLNTRVATHHSARTLNLLHAFYGLGTTTGPVIMTSVLMAGFAWQRGYAIVGRAQIGLALCFAATRTLWPPPVRTGGPASRSVPIRRTLRLRGAQLGMLTFFLYTGMEAAAGTWIFSLLAEERGLPLALAGTAASAYWGGLLLGRLVFGLLPGGVRPLSLLRPCIAATVLASAALALVPGSGASLAAAAFLGCACGPIFPCLIAATPQRLGTDHTGNAVGFQIAAAAVGQALLPALVGVLAHATSLASVPLALFSMALALVGVYELLERGAEAPPVPQTVW